MKDPADNKTLPLISETVTKKRGRPATGKAKTAAQRKAEQRKRDIHEIYALKPRQWNRKTCLLILSDSELKEIWPMAWGRIGVLESYVFDDIDRRILS